MKNLYCNYTHLICTSNHMFKGEIWDKFTKFTFFEILKSPEGNEGDFEISKNESGKFFADFMNKTCDS